METNAAYGFSQQNPLNLTESVYDNDCTYEDMETLNGNAPSLDNKTNAAKTNTLIMSEKKQDLMKPNYGGEQAKRKNIGASIVVAVAIVAVLALAVGAVITSVLLRNISSQEIESLRLDITDLREMLSLQFMETANLREMLNQTETNFKQEVQSFQQEFVNLREMLNETGLNTNHEIQSLQLEIENLRTMLLTDMQDQENLTREVQNFKDTLQAELEILQKLIPKGTIENPVTSCSDIRQDSPSGEYWIQANDINYPVQVYCDMTRTYGNTTGGWTRVANLDMTDPNQQCPDELRLVTRNTAPLRTCGNPGQAPCGSTAFPVHGIEYSHVCGRIVGYQFGFPDSFVPYEFRNFNLTIDDLYVDGCILTHGQSPRQHIWTFAAAGSQLVTDDHCRCAQPESNFTGDIPPFIGEDYFCDSGSNSSAYQYIFFDKDPLWNGQGCITSTCCSFNNPPWFFKELPQPTTDDIELRLCSNQGIGDEDTPLEIVELYIK